MEKLIKQKLIERGFSEETLLNNRGLIGAVIDETKEVITVTQCCIGEAEQLKLPKLTKERKHKLTKGYSKHKIKF